MTKFEAHDAQPILFPEKMHSRCRVEDREFGGPEIITVPTPAPSTLWIGEPGFG
jgi:hypothetical protein